MPDQAKVSGFEHFLEKTEGVFCIAAFVVSGDEFCVDVDAPGTIIWMGFWKLGWCVGWLAKFHW